MLRHSRTIRRSKTATRSAVAGFTLVELLVVISIIIVVASVALPSIISLFNAGAESQAANLLAAQLTAARALAIQRATFAAVHVQMAITDDPRIKPGCYVAVMIYDETNRNFQLAEGFSPRRMPGTATFGEISDTFADFASGQFRQNALTMANQLDDFRSFSIVFTSTGSVVRYVNGLDVQFDTTNVIFAGDDRGMPVDFTDDVPPLWDSAIANGLTGNGEPGVTATVLFDNALLLTALTNAAVYLEQHGRLMPMNVYTGQPLDR